MKKTEKKTDREPLGNLKVEETRTQEQIEADNERTAWAERVFLS